MYFTYQSKFLKLYSVFKYIMYISYYILCVIVVWTVPELRWFDFGFFDYHGEKAIRIQ